MNCDLLILGGGPGGYTAAFRASELGQKVILVECAPNIGGVCLHRGCISSKTLLQIAYDIDETKRLNNYGVNFGELKIDLDKIRNLKNSIIDRLTLGLNSLIKKHQIEIVRGNGKFIDANTLEVSSAQEKTSVYFKNAIIATGSRNTSLPCASQNDPRILDSTSALEINFIPKKMLIIGAGAIGLEMTALYHALSSEITIFEFQDQILPGIDKDLLSPLQRHLKKQQLTISTKTRVISINSTKEGLIVSYAKEEIEQEPLTFDAVLVAIGRKPNSHLIDIEKTGVALDACGFIQVNDNMQTSVEHIYAVGDVADKPMLAHKAYLEGKIAAELIANKKTNLSKLYPIPYVAYTDPEIAIVGITEREAREKNIDIDIKTFQWLASARSLTLGRPEGLTKLIFEKSTSRIIGAGITGYNASELISELTLAIEMKCTAENLASIVRPHPTLSETIGFAIES